MDAPDIGQISHQLTELRKEHRLLDQTIAELVEAAARDDVGLRRMKRRKLQLKDAIARLESRLIPDLDA